MDTNEVAARLADQLAAAGFARAQLQTSSADGPAGARIVRVAAADAYPGSGVATALVASDGRVYGAGALGFADFARAHGWLDAPPAAEVAVEVLSLLRYAGLLQVDDAVAPSLRRDATGLALELTRRLFTSGARERLRVHVGASGAEELLAEQPATPSTLIAIDDTVALQRALDDGGTMPIQRAIEALGRQPLTPRGRAALARAALSANETVASDALMALGDEADGLAALRSALAAAAPERRAVVLRLLDGLFGADAVARLEEG